MNAWKLSQKQQEIQDRLEDGEDMTTELVELQENMPTYVQELGNLLDFYEMQASGAKAKKDEWSEYQEHADYLLETTKKMLINIVKDYGTAGQITTPDGQSFRLKNNPPKVEIINQDLIPEQYKSANIKVPYAKLAELSFLGIEYKLGTIDVDKVAIKDLHKDGVGVNGTEVVQGQSLKR